MNEKMWKLVSYEKFLAFWLRVISFKKEITGFETKLWCTCIVSRLSDEKHSRDSSMEYLFLSFRNMAASGERQTLASVLHHVHTGITFQCFQCWSWDGPPFCGYRFYDTEKSQIKSSVNWEAWSRCISYISNPSNVERLITLKKYHTLLLSRMKKGVSLYDKWWYKVT